MDQKKEHTTGFHSFDSEKNSSISSTLLLIILIVCILLGAGTGYILAQHKQPTAMTMNSGNGSSKTIEKGKIYGSIDTATFKDSAEGVLRSGGIEGEGQYHLQRQGGESQNVYVTSSSVDLSQFIDHTIRIKGATQTAKHAGWLMDVGQVEVLQ